MEIISRFVREQKRYTKGELQQIFLFDDQQIHQFLKNLKSYGVLKSVKNNDGQNGLSDLVDEDLIAEDGAADHEACLYVFTYVGVITIGSRILKIYPKYIRSKPEPLTEMRQVLKVLERYSQSEEQALDLYYGNGENHSFHLLAVILYLLHDYYEYGVYINSEDTMEVNGEGEIIWERTISGSMPLIGRNCPYYIENFTRRTDYDDLDYFKRLHEYVLTDCSRQLRDAQIEELFDLVPVELSDAQRDDFGEKEYILERLMAELGVQYQTHRQILLKTLYAYIAQDQKLLGDEHGISMYGTNAFHMVWEKVCADVFDSQLPVPLGRLKLSVPLSEEFDGKKNLLDLIEKPFWQLGGQGRYAKDTLRPDFISVGNFGGMDYFVILDAKYYDIQNAAGMDLTGYPGVGDVTKQYLYELAYRPFIKAHGIRVVKNCFVMPAEGNEIQRQGKVSLPMLGGLGLEDIQVCLVPAETLYQHYLAGTHLSISVLLRELYPIEHV